ncbi:MAG: phosphatase PAP2 family protein [Candidatus Poseidoniaceae archaeon]
MSPWTVMMSMILFLTPLICYLFSLHDKDSRLKYGTWFETIRKHRYYLHALGYVVIIRWKNLTDGLNEPIKERVGHWTDAVHGIEGNAVLWIQNVFYNDALTAFLNFHYLFVYLFLIYVTTVYYAYMGDRDMTDKVTLNYLLIYAIAVPYYLFFNVEVTSSWIPGMDALLYHDGWYSTFYATHDPLDNAVPSLHVAIPFGILMLNYLHVKSKGQTLKEWRHYRYHTFILINTIIFIFAILYLGIHWIIDIPLGMLVGGIGALFIHHIQPRLRNDHGSMFKGVNREKVWKHVLVEGTILLILFAAIMGAVNHQDATNEEQASFRLGPGDTVQDILAEVGSEDTITTTISNMDDSIVLEYAIITVDLAEDGFSDFGVDWERMQALAIQHCEQQVACTATLLPNESIDLNLQSPNVYTFVFLHHAGDEGTLEVKVESMYEHAENSMTNAVALSLPSLYITGFVVYRLYRLNNNGRHWYDSRPSHTWEEE